MALIGPTMADYMRTGHLTSPRSTKSTSNSHTIVPIMEQPIAQLPEPAAPVEIVPLQAPVDSYVSGLKTEPVVTETPVQKCRSSRPPVSAPAPPEPCCSTPSSTCTTCGSAESCATSRMPQPLPAPLPPPMAPLPAGPPGMNQPIPLDMPMPGSTNCCPGNTE